MFPAEVPSPLVAGSAAALVETSPTATVAALYRQRFGYDTAADFAGLPDIATYECKTTGYRFFYPHSFEGKERLYLATEDLESTCQEDQWEHEAILQHTPKGARVLDVGCGRGTLLAKVKEHRLENVAGIELNKSAAAFTRGRSIEVVEALVGDHAQQHPDSFDVVTGFQVPEHIADPLPSLRDCIRALKSGGLLVIAVPDNDGFQRFDPTDVLNQPPHQVGLWTPGSRSALPTLLPLDLQSIEEEPLREQDWYQQVMEQRYLPKRWQRPIYYRLGGDRIAKHYIAKNAQSISGHTMMTLYDRAA